MTDRELMQDVLDALNNFDKGNHGMRWQVPLIKSLRARLAQPEREWVGLTGYEVNECAAGCHNGNSVQDAIRKAEAKLREKNG